MMEEEVYKIRHTTISNDQFALEKLQSKNLPYFVERIMEISEGNISTLNETGKTKNDFDELRIFAGMFTDISLPL